MNSKTDPEANDQIDQSMSETSAEQNPMHSKNLFQVNTSLIHAVPSGEQASELQPLGIGVYNQDDFEQGIIAQVDQALAKREQERLHRILGKELKQTENELKLVKSELSHLNRTLRCVNTAQLNQEGKRRKAAIENKMDIKVKQCKKLEAKHKKLLNQMKGATEASMMEIDDVEVDYDKAMDAEESALDEVLGNDESTETDQQKLIRTGEMTPFGTTVQKTDSHSSQLASTASNQDTNQATASTSNALSDFERYMQSQQALDDQKSTSQKSKNRKKQTKSRSNQKEFVSTTESAVKEDDRSKANFFDEKDKRVYREESDFSNYRQSQPRFPKLHHNFTEDGAVSDFSDASDEYIPDVEEWKDSLLDEEFSADDIPDDVLDKETTPRKEKEAKKINGKKLKRKSKKHGGAIKEFKLSEEESSADELELETKRRRVRKERCEDDGDEKRFQKRIKQYKRQLLEDKMEKIEAGDMVDEEMPVEEVDGDFKVPGHIWDKLFKYQKTGVKWLWELHCQSAGGILGDEMGLGKTIQMIVFLAGLRQSNLKDKGFSFRGLGPVIIVCPTTVMHQWVREFHIWYPPVRVAILHSSGTYACSEANLIRSIIQHNGVLVTSYSSLLIHQDDVIKHDWHYVILDEGHKIRNPDAQITIACKQFRTSHRLILSGSPMQNNLKELWSLFDFVFPGKLGTLPDFMEHFSVPITQGGYSNASQVQVQTAYRCACVLRDTINPYLLRRLKADVKLSIQLPNKNEQVLFCRMTSEQRDIYKEYLNSKECQQILSGKFLVFPGLITLRKICNHPDLATGGPKVLLGEEVPTEDKHLHYGYYKRSGKMIVVESLLRIWHKQQQRVLLFCQGKQMLDILEHFVQDQNYTYVRMDGTTTISSRQPLINRFNEDQSLFIFLLTTRVGGLGINLTGANRVLLFDPDWNPATDTQARERAWRIGQTKQVTIYRLLTTGTIEEKIYHRQIFKQFLTNRVLKDPKQRRFFKNNDLHELFTLGDDENKAGTETAAIFAGTGSEVTADSLKKTSKSDKRKNRFDEIRKQKDLEAKNMEKKLDKMRELARQISLKIGQRSEQMMVKGNDGADKPSVDNEECVSNTDPVTNEQIHVEEASDKNNVKETNFVQSETKATINGSTKAPTTQKLGKLKDSSRKIKKHKKKKRKKDAELEGERISYLSRHGNYNKQDSDEDSKQDDLVLKNLFKKTGIQSAMQHDTIMMASHPDYALVEGEAERVAKEAAMALKRSRSQCQPAATGIPTWTGTHGVPPNCRARFGKKKNSLLVKETEKESPQKTTSDTTEKTSNSQATAEKHFDGNLVSTKASEGAKVSMSSSELLMKMRQRNQLVSHGNHDDEEPAMETDPQEVELITDIRNYIAFQCAIDGQATTEEILREFQPQLPPQDSAKFKAMLKQICYFDKINAIGIWMLKPEFR